MSKLVPLTFDKIKQKLRMLWNILIPFFHQSSYNVILNFCINKKKTDKDLKKTKKIKY